MKFASVLRNSSEELPDLADLFALYKQLKKSLKRIPNRGEDTDHSEASQDTQPSNLGALSQQRLQQQQQQQEGSEPEGEDTILGVDEPENGRQLSDQSPASDGQDAVDQPGTSADVLQPVQPPQQLQHVASALEEEGGSGQDLSQQPADACAAATASTGAEQQQQMLDEQEQEFLRTITQDVQKLNDSYIEKEEVNVIKLGTLEEKAAAATSPAELQEAYKAFVDFHGELLLLLHWSILAYTGLVKILKKHHKRTGLLLRAPHLENLLSQPFCSVEVTCDMVRRAEEQVNSLAAVLKVPPACPMAAAAGAAAAAAAAKAGMHPAETVNSPFYHVGSGTNLRAMAAAAADSRAPGAAAAARVDGAAGPSSIDGTAGPSSVDGDTQAEPAVLDGVDSGGGHKRGPEEAGLGQGSQMMRRTRAALNVWQQLQVTAATPSTVLPSGYPEHLAQTAASGMTNNSAA